MYLIADTHFSHKRIIELCDRPFSSVKEMDEVMIDNWNSVVGPRDKIIHLGDFALTGIDRTKEILSRLNGYKILLRGSHDKGRGIKRWMELGFDEVSTTEECMFTHSWDNLIVTFICSHEPTKRDLLECSQLLEDDECKNFGYTRIIRNIHGHTHNSPTNLNPELYKFISVENTNYKPIHIDELESWITEGVKE